MSRWRFSVGLLCASLIPSIVSADGTKFEARFGACRRVDFEGEFGAPPIRLLEHVVVLNPAPNVEIPRPASHAFNDGMWHAYVRAADFLAWADGHISFFLRVLSVRKIEVEWQFASHRFPVSHSYGPMCGSWARVFPNNTEVPWHFFPDVLVTVQLDGRHIGTKLSLSAFPILAQVEDQGHQSPSGKYRLNNDRPKHGVSPSGGAFLSNNVSLLALIPLFCVGIGLIYLGFFRCIDLAVDRARDRYAVLGWGCAFGGAGIAATCVPQ